MQFEDKWTLFGTCYINSILDFVIDMMVVILIHLQPEYHLMPKDYSFVCFFYVILCAPVCLWQRN